MKIERERIQKITEQEYERTDGDDLDFWAEFGRRLLRLSRGRKGRREIYGIDHGWKSVLWASTRFSGFKSGE
jgi:hypothetical protein